MYVLYIKDKGKIIRTNNDKTYRSPIKFKINSEEIEFYKIYLKTYGFIDFEIYKDSDFKSNSKDVDELSKKKPINDINMNLNFKLQ